MRYRVCVFKAPAVLDEGDFVGCVGAAFELPQSWVVVSAGEDEFGFDEIDVGLEIRNSAEVHLRHGAQ